jgi:TonB family protein
MKTRRPKPPSIKKVFYWSLGGHCSLFLILIVYSFLSSCSRKPAETAHVFKLVSPPSPAPAASTPPVPAQTEPKVQPQPAPPKSEPKPQPKAEPAKPKPTETPKPRVTETPKPKPKPTTPAPKPQVQSYEEFLKSTQTETRPTPVPTQPKPTVTAPDPLATMRQEIESMLRDARQQTNSSSASEIQALHAYIGTLRTQLDRLWEQPTNLPPGEWIAFIEFTVTGTGQITKVRFVKRSGSDEFDQSVIRAMNRFDRTQPPPDRKSHTFEIPFRMSVR